MTQEPWTFRLLPRFLFCISQMFLHAPCLPSLSSLFSCRFRALLLPSCLSSLASFSLLPLSSAPAHLNLVPRPSAQASQMLATIWPSLSKISRITRWSLNWSSDMAFLSIHSLHLSIGAPRWAPLSKVVLPSCSGEGLLPTTSASGSTLSSFQVLCWRPSVPLTWRKKGTCLSLYLARVCLSVPSPLGMDILRNVLEWNCAALSKERHP